MSNKASFTSEFFRANRRKLLLSLADARPVVVTANGLVQRGADSSLAFTQDANFWYLTGIDYPDIILVMDGDREFLIVPGREAGREAFDGAVDIEAIKRISGIEDVLDEINGWNRLDGLLSPHPAVATLQNAPTYIAQFGMYANPAREHLLKRLQKHVDSLDIVDIRENLALQRMIKQPEELAAIQQAIDITAASLNKLLKTDNLKSYKYEYQLEADISREFRYQGASGHAFEPIVASGKNACTLHNVANRSKLSEADLIVCDIGAEVYHYAADITRTVSLSGKPSKRQRDVYKAVQAAQSYALEQLRPGIKLSAYEDKVAKFVGTQLKQLGLIKTLNKQLVRQYFPHSASHFMGLNVHDVGDYGAPLKAGVVITCEPGIYIQEEGIGVRLEDDVLITKSGNRVLSAGCAKSI